MSRPFVYLASPIDHADPQLIPVIDARSELADLDLAVYAPALAWASVDTTSPWVQAQNRSVLSQCDAMVALLPDGVYTLGVPMEIEQARQQSAPIVVIGGSNAAQSLALLEAGVHICPTPTQAGKWIITELQARLADRDMDEGERAEERRRFLNLVRHEIIRAANKYPDSHTNTMEDWASIFTEEALEVLQAWTDRNAAARADKTEEAMLAVEQTRLELVQTAAMAFRFWEALG